MFENSQTIRRYICRRRHNKECFAGGRLIIIDHKNPSLSSTQQTFILTSEPPQKHSHLSVVVTNRRRKRNRTEATTTLMLIPTHVEISMLILKSSNRDQHNQYFSGKQNKWK